MYSLKRHVFDNKSVLQETGLPEKLVGASDSGVYQREDCSWQIFPDNPPANEYPPAVKDAY